MDGWLLPALARGPELIESRESSEQGRTAPRGFSRWRRPAGLLALVLVFYGPLLLPASVLAVRDFPRFHLPLRANLQQAILDQGLPRWDASLHGGQPILSNPNYAALYPATWLTLALPPTRALHLTLLLHVVLGMAGAYALARHLGCRPLVATLAVVAFMGSGAIVTSTNTFTLFCGLAWWPWVTLWGDRAWRAVNWRRACLWIVATAIGLALQLLAGEPVAVLLSGLTLAALALDAGLSSRSARATQDSAAGRAASGSAVLGRVATIAGLAALLAAIQLVPTAQRLAGTARGEAAFQAEAGTWSMHPARLAEALWPHIYGDPHRAESGLYFGSYLHDGAFPYVISIYPGLLLTLLGLAALIRGAVPRVLAWRIAAASGLILALGHYLPLFPWLQRLPPLNLVRYPEKFIILTVLTIGLAGVLGLERVLRARESTPDRQLLGQVALGRLALGRLALGRLALSRVALGLALVVTLSTFGIAAALQTLPDVAQTLVLHGSLLTPTNATLAEATAWLQRHWWWATLWSSACLAWLFWLRFSRSGTQRSSLRLLGLAALLLTCLDLAVHARGSQQLIPSSRLTEPPAIARTAAESGQRLFTDVHTLRHPDLYLRQPERVAQLARLSLAIQRLEPYIGTLWGLEYVFHADYDRMLTRWGRRNQHQLWTDWQRDREAALRLLGAWSVESWVRNVPLEEQLAAKATHGESTFTPKPIELQQAPYRLPRVRPVPEVQFHLDAETALDALRADGYRFPWRDHVVCESEDCSATTDTVHRHAPRPQLSDIVEHGHRVQLSVVSQESPAFLIVARTFDPGWQAWIQNTSDSDEGRVRLPLHPTASGQIGVEVPPGAHRLTLTYQQPGLKLGGFLTSVGLMLCFLLLRVYRTQ